jgi:16S rRNA (guanine966-N2)-methyltransferase
VRVVAGTLRGRKLRAVAGEVTRPTADRVKEALFSILGPLDGARVLDLYAGTGALGIEALSRGAGHSVFVESSREALSVLKANVEALTLSDRVAVVASEVARAKRAIERERPYDLVFVDPPYEELAKALVTVADLTTSFELLTSEGVLVVEHASRDAVLLPNLEAVDTRRYGSTTLTFFRAAIKDG